MLADDDLGRPARGRGSPRSTSAPAPITSTRPGCMNGSAARASWVIASSRSATRRTSSARDPAWWMRSGSYARQVQRHRRDRGDRAGQADQGPRLVERHGLAAPARSPRRCRRAPPPPRAAVGGSDVQVPLGHPYAADVDRPRRAGTASVAEHELGRAAADVDDEARARRRSPASSRVAPANDSAASSSPVTTSGSTPSALAHAGDELVAVRDVARRRRRDEPHPLGAGRAHDVGVARRRRRRSAPAPRARSRPVRSTPCPSRTISIRRSTSRSVPGVGVDVGDQQPDRVGAAVDRRDPRHGVVLVRGARTAGPPVGQQVERLVAERVDARSRRERVRDEHVQALHPVGHAAGRDAVDLRHLLDRVAGARRRRSCAAR